MQVLTLPSPAKLNLFLHILGKREDGYHNIQTVFQLIDFCDELHFVRRTDRTIKLTPELLGVPSEKNLITRAAALLQQHAGVSQGVSVTLHKRLPVGGGIGGGSSNAATALLALNRLWNLHLPIDELASLGAELGSDVPVFVYGHSAWGEGTGTTLTPMILPKRWFVLLIPPIQVGTENLYQDSRLTRDSRALTISDYQIAEGHNDFEPVVREAYPEIDRAMQWLAQFAKPQLSGTGCVVFSGFDSELEAGKIAAQVPKPYKCIVVKGLNKSPVHQALCS